MSQPRYTTINTDFDTEEKTTKIPDGKIIIIFTVIFLTFSSVLLIYNKIMFNAFKSIQGFPYPLTAAWIQVAGVVILLHIYNFSRQKYIGKYQTKDLSVLQQTKVSYLKKSLYLLPAAIGFAAVISLSNLDQILLHFQTFQNSENSNLKKTPFFEIHNSITIYFIFLKKGLFYAPANIHVLLRSSEIIWIVIFAFFISKEKPTRYILISICILVAGTLMVGINATEFNSEFLGVLFNLLSALSSAIMVVVLRWGCVKLRKHDPQTTFLEITVIKMQMSVIFIVIAAFIVEEMKPLKILFTSDQTSVQLLVFGGIIITGIFQSAVVGIAKYNRATSMGVIQQSKIIPETILSIIVFGQFSWTVLHILGAILTIIGTILFAYIRYRENLIH